MMCGSVLEVLPLIVLVLGASGSLGPMGLGGAYQLPICHLLNQTVSVEKAGCPRCYRVETTICSGHCVTKDPVRVAPRLRKMFQNVCTYKDVQYRLFEMPDCPPGIDPIVYYPVALSCSCSLCAMTTSDCTSKSLQPDYCTSQSLNYYD
ncbi:hypothetical protein CRUP_026812 [Coryphaenoides rupestris]|nr:hypothetical protein CRUP_026812 [Coryphaenoides rupestris]